MSSLPHNNFFPPYIVLATLSAPKGVDMISWIYNDSGDLFILLVNALEINEWVAPGSNKVQAVYLNRVIIPSTTAFDVRAFCYVSLNTRPCVRVYWTIACHRGWDALAIGEGPNTDSLDRTIPCADPQFLYDFCAVFVTLDNFSSYVLFSHKHNNFFPDYNSQSVSYYIFDTTAFLQLHDED